MGYELVANVNGGSVDPEQLRPPPGAKNVFVGCGDRDNIDNTIEVGAYIPATDFLRNRQNIQKGVKTTLTPTATGVYHYFQPNLSWGFRKVKLNYSKYH